MKSWSKLGFWGKPWEGVQDKLYYNQDQEGKVFLPHPDNIFKALELTPRDKVKVVILGQDPYPTKGHAHGLAFSVPPHISPLPPSLRNIFKEYQNDLGYPTPRNGDLRVWAERGVLLLNSILTVEEGKSLSHAGIGWEKLSYEVVKTLVNKGDVCFVLWGKKAQEYEAACAPCPVVRSPHPSPLSKGFLGSKPFSRVNQELEKLGVEKVDWRLA